VLNTEQIRSAAQNMTIVWSMWPGGYLMKETSGDGPYYIVAAVNAHAAPYLAKVALDTFAGVAIPAVTQRPPAPPQWAPSFDVVTSLVTLHVLPKLVYDVVYWNRELAFFLEPKLQLQPSLSPPTEVDMAKVLVTAMSAPGEVPGLAGLSRAVALACDALGWRSVAALVNAMGPDMLSATDDVAATLLALIASPALAG